MRFAFFGYNDPGICKGLNQQILLWSGKRQNCTCLICGRAGMLAEMCLDASCRCSCISLILFCCLGPPVVPGGTDGAAPAPGERLGGKGHNLNLCRCQ